MGAEREHGEHQQHGGEGGEQDAQRVDRIDQERGNRGAEAHNQQDIRNVGADDVADGHLGAPLDGGRHADGQFRKRGAEGHDGDADHRFGDAQPVGDAHGRIHEQLSAADQAAQARENQYDHLPDGHRGLGQFLFFTGLLAGFEIVPQVGREAQQQYDSLPTVDAGRAGGKVGKEQEEGADADAERDVAPDVAARVVQRQDQRRDAQDQQGVEEV